MKATSTRRFAGWTLVASTLVVLALATMMTRSPARAEENLGEHNFITEIGAYKYVQYLYPNLNQAFYLPKKYETRFDIHNTKFWKVEYYEHVGDTRASLKPAIDINSPYFVTLRFDVSFFTPRGELMSTFKGIRPNWYYSTPHNTTSLEYDRLQVRIRNHGDINSDFRFVTLDPVDPVKGTPIPPGRDIHL